MRRIFFVMMIIGNLLFMPTIHAELKTYTGVGEYMIGERDTMEEAKRSAKEYALRNAVEKAGVLISSRSRVEDFELVEDVITSRTGAILHVLDVNYDFSNFTVKATVKVDIDSEDLNRRLQSSESEVKKNTNKIEPLPLNEANENLYLSNRKVEEATALISQGKLEEVPNLLDAARQLSANNAAVYEKFGAFYKAKSDFNNAIIYYDKAIELDKNNGNAYLGRAECYKALGDKFNAHENFDKAKNINSAQEKIRTARKLCTEEKYDAAQPFASDSLALNPNNAWAWVTLGNIYNGKQEYKNGIFYYEKAIELNSEIAEAYNGLGHAYMQLGKYNKTTDNLRKAIDNFSKAIGFNQFHYDAYTYRSRGECYQTLGDVKRSQEDFATARKLGWEI